MPIDHNDDFDLDMSELDALLDEQRKRMEMGTKLEVVQFTDPLCGWCYGMEPAMTKLRYQLGDQIDFSYKMGLMIPDARAVIGFGSEGLQRFQALKQQLAYGYTAMENMTGMPMSAEHVEDLQPEDITSLQSSLGYFAVKITEGTERAMGFLRLLRQAAFAFDTPIGSRESVTNLAESFGADMQAYERAIDSGEANHELQKEAFSCRSYNIDAFPTLLLTYGSNSIMLRGYQPVENFSYAISRLTEGSIELDQPEYSQAHALDLLAQYGRVAGEEMRVVFNLTEEGLAQATGEMMRDNLIEVTPRGKGFFITRR